MTIFSMSLAAGVMVPVIVVVRALALHKLPKRTFLALWGVVLCRLTIPFTIPSPFSIYNLAASASGVTGRASVLTSPSGMASMANTTAVADTAGVVITEALSNAVSPVTAVWLSGAAALALFFLATHMRCRRDYQSSLPVESASVREWLREHPTRRKVAIRQSDKIAAPLTYGIFRPVVLLPKNTDWTDTARLRYVLAHEFTHVRRFDILAKWLLAAALCVHWFNPLVWVMYILANRDIELSCDEKVVRTLGENTKSAYALTLIGLEEQRSGLAPLVSNFAKNAIEERIRAIMKIKKTSLTGILLAAALVAGTTTAFATSGVNAAAAGYDTVGAPQLSENTIPPNAVVDPNDAAFDLTALFPQEALAGDSAGNTAPLPSDIDEKIKAVILHEIPGVGTTRLISVSAKDEIKFSAEDWQIILLAIEQGFVKWETETATDGKDAAAVPSIDGSGFSWDTGVLTDGKDAVVFDEATMPSPIYNIPELQKIVGNLAPGRIFTSIATFAIAEGQLVTFSGSWSTDFQNFDVGLYDTVSGEYTWFSCSGGVLENYTIAAEHDSVAYKLAFRNPPTNIYDTNYRITSYAVVA
jgi:beta-lactamase regulating signal transducer with metallopeptidase domain